MAMLTAITYHCHDISFKRMHLCWALLSNQSFIYIKGQYQLLCDGSIGDHGVRRLTISFVPVMLA